MHIELSFYYVIALCSLFLIKSVIISLLKTVDSLGIFILLFPYVLYFNTGYEEGEYQDCPDL
jgi:hypothetical protein